MELNESIRSRAHRTFKSMVGMRRGDQAAALLPAEVKAMMLTDEELLGVYQNSETNALTNLIFTTRGVYKFWRGWFCLEYEQMKRVVVKRGANFDKLTADTLLVRCKDWRLFKLKVSGAAYSQLPHSEEIRRFPDLYEVDRFMMRVIDRVQKDENLTV